MRMGRMLVELLGKIPMRKYILQYMVNFLFSTLMAFVKTHINSFHFGQMFSHRYNHRIILIKKNIFTKLV